MEITLKGRVQRSQESHARCQYQRERQETNLLDSMHSFFIAPTPKTLQSSSQQLVKLASSLFANYRRARVPDDLRSEHQRS